MQPKAAHAAARPLCACGHQLTICPRVDFAINRRNNGVDGTRMILSRISSEYRPTILSKPVYNALYKVVIDKNNTIPIEYIYKMH